MKKMPIEELLLESLKIEGETGNEERISGFYEDHCIQLGLKTTRDSFGNVIAIMDSGRPGKILNFNGHMDTKPVVEELRIPREEDGFIYGRGACDMRGAIASMLDSSADLGQKSDLNGKIVYTFVVCEETGNPALRQQGTPTVISYLCSKSLDPDAAIVGEPSQPWVEKAGYSLCDSERGRYTSDITLLGEPAHASFYPSRGISADAIASGILIAIDNLNKKYNKQGANITPIFYKEVPQKREDRNMVPASCTILLDIRYPDKDVLNEVIEEIRTIVRNLSPPATYLPENLEGKSSGEPWENHGKTSRQFRNLILDSYDKVTGSRPDVIRSVFGTDGRYIKKALPDIPIHIAGPGYQEIAHTRQENIPIIHLRDYSRIYTEIALSYLAGK